MRLSRLLGMTAVVALAAVFGGPGPAKAATAPKPTVAAAAPAYVPPDPTAVHDGYFIDADGRMLLSRPVYHQWFGKRRDRYYLRAAVEQVGILTAELGYYWLKADSNTTDWDYPNFKQRFWNLEAVRFDNNLSITNFVIHPLAGAMYYNFSRVNGLSIYESLMVSTLSSAIYEWWLEWLEKVSVNDLVFTPFGGWAPGEFLFKLESYLNSAPGGGAWGNHAMQYTLGSPVYLHNRLDNAQPPAPIATDALGFSSAYSHEFTFGYAVTAVDNDLGRSGIVSDVDIGARLYAMPGFLREGSFETSFSDGNFSDVETRMSFSGDGWADLDLWFSNAFAGVYSQDIAATHHGLKGHAMLVAANSAARYVRRWLLGRTDMWALAHLVGPDFRYWIVDGPFHAELQATAHGDAAGIQSLPYPDWTADFGRTGTKTELQRHGYYFALGTSGRASVRVGYGGAELGVQGEVGVYDSIEGLDREQPTVTRDIHNRDQIVQLGGWFRYAIPGAPLRFGVSGAETLRRSQMPPLVQKRRDRRLAMELDLYF